MARRRTTRRERGTGNVTRLANGRWKATLVYEDDPREGRKRRVSANGATRTEAMSKAKEKLRKLILDDDPLAIDHMPTVGEWCARWVENAIRPRRAPNTYSIYEQRIRCSITPILGNIRLDRIRADHARLMEARLTTGWPERGIRPVSGATARLAQTVLNLALEDAVRNGIIKRNPLDGLERPALDPSDKTQLSPTQAMRMIALEPDPVWRMIWRLLFVTGMRIGEAGAITPESVRDVDGVVCVDVSWQVKRFPHIREEQDMPRGVEHRHLGGTMWLTRPKTRRGRRVIPLPGELGRDLKAWVAQTEPGSLAFLSGHRRPIDRETARFHWDKAVARAGLPHVAPHSARHTAATMLARLRVPDLCRKTLIGHKDIETTDLIYTKVDLGMLVDTMKAVEDAYLDAAGDAS